MYNNDQNPEMDILQQQLYIDDGTGKKRIDIHSIPVKIILPTPNPNDWLGQNGQYAPQKPS